MKAILPVAGAGSRLRPLTNTQPKTLVSVAGKPILGHILDRLLPVGVSEVVLIVGQWGERIVDYVRDTYSGLKVSAIPQDDPQGLGHAVYLGREAFDPDEPVLIVLGDTIFHADLRTPIEAGQSAIGVRRVPNPSDFGVVQLDGERVERLIEKPADPPTDLAIVGLYYVRQSGLLFESLGEIIEENVRVKGEYQLTDGLQRMIDKGEPLRTFPVDNWWDCGNPQILLETNRQLLHLEPTEPPTIAGSIIIPPVAIHPTARIERSVIGPYVSIAEGAVVQDCILRDSIINESSRVSNMLLEHSLIGEGAEVDGHFVRLTIGDHSVLQSGRDGQQE